MYPFNSISVQHSPRQCWTASQRRWFPQVLLAFLLSAGSLLSMVHPAYADSPPSYITKWGSKGSGTGQFNNPLGMVVDNSGNLYVADLGNRRIQKFDSSGKYLLAWGGNGNGDGQFADPTALAIDSQGNIYVTDRVLHRIQKFTGSGTFISKWGAYGSGNGQLSHPWGIAIDSSDNVYVTEAWNNRVQKFTSSGAYITKWGSYGSGNGQFDVPLGIAVDSSSNVYVAEWSTNRIQKFTSSGAFVMKWGSFGSGDGQLNRPHGVSVDSSNNVYVGEGENHRIQKFTSSGVFLTKWGSFGSGDGQFNRPYMLALDGNGSSIYIAEWDNHRIQKFGLPTPPVISVSGNSVTIAANDTTPTLADYTDFSNVTAYSGRLVRTFTIRNIGGSDLTGLGVSLTGAGASDYAVTLPPGSSVAVGSSTTFQIRFAPSAVGARTATVSVASNDSARNPYTFAITGAGVAATPGPVVAWGNNDEGQSSVPSGLGNVIDIKTGYKHSVVLKDDGTVTTWGGNTLGQRNVPVGLNNVVAISTLNIHSLALKSDGTVVAWGYNGAGQSTVPSNLTNVTAVSAGGSHSLALKSDGTVVGWGYNEFGQSTPPAGLTNVIAIAAGDLHSLALKSDGTVVAWGNSAYTSVPAGLKGVVAISAHYFHSLALKGDGTVVAWGRNDYGQTAVPLGLNNVVAIAAGANHSLALKADGTVVVWGSNSHGQGVIPNGLTGVTAISASFNHNLALLAADTSAPDTSITSQPANPTNGSNVSFSFTGVDNMTPANGLTFQCQLDGGAFTACTSPQSYSALGGGSHTFAVKAVDGAGNSDGSAASYTWTLIPPAPVIAVTGNGAPISTGANSPTALDYTDFLSATVNSGSMVRTFVIRNNGNADLSGLSVSVTGGNSSDFTISQAPGSSVTPGSSTTFQVRFAPSALGTRTTTVNIASNDSTQNPYTFAVAGLGVPIPRPVLSVPGTPIRVQNGRISVPVQFTANGTSIAAVGFALNHDNSCLLFDATDSNGDGLPDAITGLPSAFAPSISYNSAKGLEIALLDDTTPIATLSTGTLFTIGFTVNPACVTTDGSTRIVALNFAATPAVSFSDPSAVDVPGDATGATIVLSFNAAPTALALSNDNLNENVVAGTTVGTFSTTDPDGGDSHSYSLVAGEGATDNTSFTIEGNTLKTTAVFNYEPQPEHAIRVRTTDGEGLFFERTLIIKANDVYEAPTGVSTIDGPFSDGNTATTDIQENAAAGSVVARLNPANPDSNNRYTYALVSGSGDSDNSSFTIEGNELKSNAVFDYETKSSYSLRVRITDRNGATFDQTITVQITNTVETMTAVDDPVDPRVTIFRGGQAGTINVLANDRAETGTISVASVTQPATGQGSVTNNTSNVSYTAPQANGNTTFTYQATDGTTTSNNATVSLSYVASHARGDCNGNGNVAAADFIAIVLEIFDTNDTLYNSQPAWWLSYTGDYAGSPLGCDANGSANGANNSSDSVTAADIICSVLIFFGHTCGTGVQAAGVDQSATLSVAAVANGGQTSIPVTLQSGGHAVAAVAFALELGNSAFDPTDANGDGIPDAVTLNVPAGVTKSVIWNAAAKRLEVVLYGASLPLPTLADGLLATVTISGGATPTLSQVSLSDADGNDLLAAPVRGLFLPLIVR